MSSQSNVSPILSARDLSTMLMLEPSSTRTLVRMDFPVMMLTTSQTREITPKTKSGSCFVPWSKFPCKISSFTVGTHSTSTSSLLLLNSSTCRALASSSFFPIWQFVSLTHGRLGFRPWWPAVVKKVERGRYSRPILSFIKLSPIKTVEGMGGPLAKGKFAFLVTELRAIGNKLLEFLGHQSIL